MLLLARRIVELDTAALADIEMPARIGGQLANPRALETSITVRTNSAMADRSVFAPRPAVLNLAILPSSERTAHRLLLAARKTVYGS
ncbi:hypothetical protein HYPGJ_30725 [Hyphomicrobium sp. GJ21]|nr:hypothetical protein HYPGJ_30725 [Hyphomicrobium sp. GJ21]